MVRDIEEVIRIVQVANDALQLEIEARQKHIPLQVPALDNRKLRQRGGAVLRLVQQVNIGHGIVILAGFHGLPHFRFGNYDRIEQAVPKARIPMQAPEFIEVEHRTGMAVFHRPHRHARHRVTIIDDADMRPFHSGIEVIGKFLIANPWLTDRISARDTTPQQLERFLPFADQRCILVFVRLHRRFESIDRLPGVSVSLVDQHFVS